MNAPAVLGDWAPGVTAAVIAAVVSVVTLILGAPLRMWVERHLERFKLTSEYDYEQRKELRTLIGRYHGRLVEAAESLHNRLTNIYAYEDERWLDRRDGAYAKTTQYRFLRVFALARAFEREAIFIDARIAEPRDVHVLTYVRALLWTTTSAKLFDGLGYDATRNTDHFYADQIRATCDRFCPERDRLLTYPEYEQALADTDAFDDVVSFFEGLHSSESRPRWDRLVVIDLVLMAFLGAVGYAMQRPSDLALDDVASRIRRPEVRRNLVERLPKLGLDEDPEMGRVRAALERATAS